MPRILVRLAVASAVFGASVSPALAAQSHAASNPALDLTFSASGAITVTLPDGTPVGSAVGAPTSIPAGYYTLFMEGPGDCSALPYLELQGPGVNVVGEIPDDDTSSAIYDVYLRPNSTYTWRNGDANPPVVYTFETSGVVQGSPSTSVSATSTGAASGGVTSNTNPVGSSLAETPAVSYRGMLVASVSSGGKLTFFYRGRSVTTLVAGKYTVAVTDLSRTVGFMLVELDHPALELAGSGVVRRRLVSVDLTSGQWFFAARLKGARNYFVVDP